MADEEKRSSKRSRFDQTEPEPKRSSRFDRRSRSPPLKQSEPRRSRSPLSAKSPMSPASQGARPDAAAAAAAAAARINAQIQAKKGIQHVDVPPIRKTESPVPKSASPSAPAGSSTSNINGDMYIADGDYIKDIEVNDLRNRYTLTKGSTQKMIKEETGADVTTRGNYYPDKSMATAANPPLYLHITSTTKDGLEKAVAKVNEMMKQELPNLVDERRFRRREPEQVERDEFGRRKWPEEKIPIDLEPIPGFNLRAQVVGHGGAYVKHIQQETRCRVQIKGRNSGFMEHGTNRESDEPMYLHVAGPDPNEVKHARELCLSLLENVREQYNRFKENPPQRAGFGYGHNQQPPTPSNPYGGYGQQSSGYAGVQSPTTPAAPPGTSGPPGASSPGGAATDYAAQYAQYYGGQDPYAAYGGYQNYVAYYQYYQQQQATQQGQGTPGATTGSGEEVPPPPPPSGSPPAIGGYNSVSTAKAVRRMHWRKGYRSVWLVSNAWSSRYHHPQECDVAG
ncbi:MAG: hypothetical protein Q9163_004150 [Psora crenata]